MHIRVALPVLVVAGCLVVSSAACGEQNGGAPEAPSSLEGGAPIAPDVVDAAASDAFDGAAASDPFDSLGGTAVVRTTLADVTAAENQTLTSDGRHFVTGDEGIYELSPNGQGGAVAVVRAQAQDCKFSGIVEVGEVLYANCYATSDSYLYAAKRTPSPEFRRVHTFEAGTRLANGLTSDAQGRLYAASTYRGRILRLTLASGDPLAVANETLWLEGTGPLTNGIKYVAGQVYWTDGSEIKRAAVNADGSAGPTRTFATGGALYDDVFVDPRGLLAADYIGGYIRAFDRDGNVLATTKVGLEGPSSIVAAPAFGAGAFVVTERSGNRVSLLKTR